MTCLREKLSCRINPIESSDIFWHSGAILSMGSVEDRRIVTSKDKSETWFRPKHQDQASILIHASNAGPRFIAIRTNAPPL
jgi:hypothetical protein